MRNNGNGPIEEVASSGSSADQEKAKRRAAEPNTMVADSRQVSFKTQKKQGLLQKVKQGLKKLSTRKSLTSNDLGVENATEEAYLGPQDESCPLTEAIEDTYQKV